MRKIWYFGVAFLLVVVGGLSLAYSSTRGELAVTETELAYTKDELTSKENELTTTQSILDATKSTLSSTEVDLASTKEALLSTQVELASTQSTLGTTRSELAATKDVLASTQSTLGTTRSELAATKDVLASTEATLAAKKVELDQARTQLSTLQVQLSSLQASYSTLQSAVGSLSNLQQSVQSLQQQIQDLEQQRRTLIVETYIGSFACTGSMEPKITCLDSASWLSNPKPEDIVVGAVISFTPISACTLRASSKNVAHRVTATKQESGIYYYRTKGDANSSDDGCWIPFSNVDGYIIKLDKNVHMENQATRDRINSLKFTMDFLGATYDSKRSYYDQKYLQYCGSLTSGCQLPHSQYVEMQQLYDELEVARIALNQAIASYNLAYDALL